MIEELRSIAFYTPYRYLSPITEQSEDSPKVLTSQKKICDATIEKCEVKKISRGTESWVKWHRFTNSDYMYCEIYIVLALVRNTV